MENPATSASWDRLLGLAVPLAPLVAQSVAGAAPGPVLIRRALLHALPQTVLVYWLFRFIPWVGGFAYILILVPLAAQRLVARPRGIPGPEAVLRVLVVVLIGFGGVWSFIGHTVLADSVATQIGWPTGSPFQIELAFATLGLSAAAFLTLWQAGGLIAGLVLAKSVFWLGAAGVHIADAAQNGNFSALNIGTPLAGDLVYPALLLWLAWKAGYLRAPQ